MWHVKQEGYEDVVVHVSFLQVFHDGVLRDLRQQDHVVHPALFNILTLPVILSLKSHIQEISLVSATGGGAKHVSAKNHCQHKHWMSTQEHISSCSEWQPQTLHDHSAQQLGGHR